MTRGEKIRFARNEDVGDCRVGLGAAAARPTSVRSACVSGIESASFVK